MSHRALALVLDPMGSVRRGAITWAISIGALVVVTVAFWPAFQGTTNLGDLIDQLPAGIIEAFGLQGFGTPAGYLRGNLYDVLVPLLLGAAAIALANGLTAAEEDAGRLELVLAQPVSRGAAFTGRSVALLAWMVLLAAVVAAFQFASDVPFGLEIAADRLVVTIMLCGLLALLHGCLALAVAGILPRPPAVLGIGLGVLVGGFVVAALFPLSDELRRWAHLSPWDWALGSDPLVNGAEPWRYVALAIPSLGLIVLGLAGFTRRDVRAA
jgi:ABC-2 type transport system permease protein